MAGFVLRISLESGPNACRVSEFFFAGKKLAHCGLRGELFVFAPAGRVRRPCSQRWLTDSLSVEPMTIEKEQSQINRSFGLDSRAAPRPAEGKGLRLARRLRSQTLGSTQNHSALEFELPEGE